MKKLMTGNEALVQGAWEAGVLVASAYPGTPSTEIIENMSARKEIYSEWAPNEKVAMEAAIGASIAGVRSLAAMKHVRSECCCGSSVYIRLYWCKWWYGCCNC